MKRILDVEVGILIHCQEDKLWEAFGIGVDPTNSFVVVRNIREIIKTVTSCIAFLPLYSLGDPRETLQLVAEQS